MKTRMDKEIVEDLKRVIKSLEFMQEQKYSSLRNLTLSYLYDIQNGNVPKQLITDKKKEIEKH